MLFVNLLTLAHAACNDYQQLVADYANNRLERFKSINIGPKAVYGPLSYDGTDYMSDFNDGLLFDDSEMARMSSVGKDGECYDAFMYGKSKYNAAAFSTSKRQSMMVVQAITHVRIHGLDFVNRVIRGDNNDPDSDVDILVINGTLYASEKGSTNRRVGIEAALAASAALRESNEPVALAAVGAASGWAGKDMSTYTFAESVVEAADKGNSKLKSILGCYYQLNGQQHWQTNNDQFDINAIDSLLSESGDGKCPETAQCLYIRAGDEKNPGKWQSMLAFGTNPLEVEKLDCSWVHLQSSDLSTN